VALSTGSLTSTADEVVPISVPIFWEMGVEVRNEGVSEKWNRDASTHCDPCNTVLEVSLFYFACRTPRTASGSSARKGFGVRVPASAPNLLSGLAEWRGKISLPHNPFVGLGSLATPHFPGAVMTNWTQKELEDFEALIKREREALNEFEHLMRMVRDQSESLETIQPRIQELLKTVSETTTRLQKFLQAGSRR